VNEALEAEKSSAWKNRVADLTQDAIYNWCFDEERNTMKKMDGFASSQTHLLKSLMLLRGDTASKA